MYGKLSVLDTLPILSPLHVEGFQLTLLADGLLVVWDVEARVGVAVVVVVTVDMTTLVNTDEVFFGPVSNADTPFALLVPPAGVLDTAGGSTSIGVVSAGEESVGAAVGDSSWGRRRIWLVREWAAATCQGERSMVNRCV